MSEKLAFDEGKWKDLTPVVFPLKNLTSSELYRRRKCSKESIFGNSFSEKRALVNNSLYDFQYNFYKNIEAKGRHQSNGSER